RPADVGGPAAGARRRRHARDRIRSAGLRRRRGPARSAGPVERRADGDERARHRARGAGRQLVRRGGGAARGGDRPGAGPVAPARVSSLVLVGTPMPGEPSERLAAAWEAEEEALERGDVEAAAEAVAEAWTSPGPVRELVEEMQRRAFELQLAAGEVEDAPDPVEEDPESLTRIDMPVLAVAGADDMPDFVAGAGTPGAPVPRPPRPPPP